MKVAEEGTDKDTRRIAYGTTLWATEKINTRTELSQQ